MTTASYLKRVKIDSSAILYEIFRGCGWHTPCKRREGILYLNQMKMIYQPLALQLDPNRRDGGEMADGRSNENDIGRSKRLQPIYVLVVLLLCDLLIFSVEKKPTMWVSNSAFKLVVTRLNPKWIHKYTTYLEKGINDQIELEGKKKNMPSVDRVAIVAEVSRK